MIMNFEEQKKTLRETLQLRFDADVDVEIKRYQLFVMFDLGFKLGLVSIDTINQLKKALGTNYKYSGKFMFANYELLQDLINNV